MNDGMVQNHFDFLSGNKDEIRKDIEARDKLRRQGGWTYDSMV